MSGRLPDFIIGGAPRSGTTWLSAALNRHPDVWLARPVRPEPKFFLVDELYDTGLESYAARWFRDAPDDAAVGEKSTNYLESAVAAERIARDLPRVRLLFLLREPVARALSNYRWSVMNGMEDADLATALDREAEREAAVPPGLRYSRPHAYFSRGLYARMLRPYLDRFPRERVLVHRFEDLIGDPRATTASVHRFLGVTERADLAEPGLPGSVNASEPGPDADPVTLARLREAYRPHNEELAELLGPGFLPWTDEEQLT